MAQAHHVPDDQTLSGQGQPLYPGQPPYDHIFSRANRQYNASPPSWDQFNGQQPADGAHWQHNTMSQQPFRPSPQPYGAQNQGYQPPPSYQYSPYGDAAQVTAYAQSPLIDPALAQEATPSRSQPQPTQPQGQYTQALRIGAAQGQPTVSPQNLQQNGTSQPFGHSVPSIYSKPASDAFAPRVMPAVQSSQPPPVSRFEVPKGKLSGGFYLIDQAALAKATNSIALNSYVNIGTQPMHLVTNRTPLPIYNARQSSKDLRQSGAGSKKALDRLAHKSQSARILVKKQLEDKLHNLLAVKRDVVSDSEEYTDSDYDSEYTDDEEEEVSPLPAVRPAEPDQAVRYDIIKATWFPRNPPPDAAQIKASLAALWGPEGVLNGIQKTWRAANKALTEAEEQKKTAELPQLQKRVTKQRDLFCFALKSLLEFGHPDVLYHLSQVMPILALCYTFLADRFKAKDYDGELPRVIYKVLLAAGGTLTSERLGESKLKKALNSMKKSSNEENQGLIQKIFEAAIAGSKKPKTSPPPQEKSTESKDAKRPAPQPVARPTTEGPATKKLKPSEPPPAATRKVVPAESNVKAGTPSIVTQKRPGERATPAPVKARVTPVANKSSTFFSTLNAATKKPTPAAPSAAPKPTPPAKPTGVTAVKDKKTSAASSKHFSFADTMALLEPKKEVVAAPKPDKKLPPETPEEKAKRLRKEARRHLRVKFRPDATLVDIKYFQHDPEEEQGHAENLKRDAGDLGGEGRMFKQHRDMLEDEDDEDDTEVAYLEWKQPSLVDFSETQDVHRQKNYAPYGDKMPRSPEKEANVRREADVLMVTYMLPSDIPDSPAEPTETPSERTVPVREFGKPSELVLSRCPKPAAQASSTTASTAPPPLPKLGFNLNFLEDTVKKLKQGSGSSKPEAPAAVPLQAPAAAPAIPPVPDLSNLLKNLTGIPQIPAAVSAPQLQVPPPPNFDYTSAWGAAQQAQQLPGQQYQQPQQGVPNILAQLGQVFPGANPGLPADPAAVQAALAAIAAGGFPAFPPPQQPPQQQQPPWHTDPNNRHDSGRDYGGPGNNKRPRDDGNSYNQHHHTGNKKQKHGRPWQNFEGGKPHKVVPCKFYSLGKCTKGDDCTFIHERE
ncbi:hypothetical protein M011DRAFT_480205 [Sporormia fimetaria CBS 119925]|uniref:C3H1-type domain-containing protein n=1 Tax=Sporormia fimetaria CBS 119925 TaxID=1340428 RepID=A0A6A6V3G4_9PLEO|nr:hypothetical protein M011DRAFT_480205 [Sporormia fimetaria CBS 119925]